MERTRRAAARMPRDRAGERSEGDDVCERFCRGQSPELTAEMLVRAAARLRGLFPARVQRAEKELGATLEDLLRRQEFRSWELSARRESHLNGHSWAVARSPNGIDYRGEIRAVVRVLADGSVDLTT